MNSFFEKLKKGMGAEAPVKEEILEKPEAGISKPKTLQKEKKPLKEPKEIPSEQVKKIEPEFKEKLLESPKNTEEVKKKKIEVKKAEETKQKPTKEKENLESPNPSIEISEKKTIEDKEKWLQPEGELAVDVYQTEEEIVIQSTIAGIKPESLDISVENDVVTIRGIRERPEEDGERDYFYQECYWGPFSRKIILPEETDPSRTDATMKEGVLTIRIPKIQKEKKRKVMVKG